MEYPDKASSTNLAYATYSSASPFLCDFLLFLVINRPVSPALVNESDIKFWEIESGNEFHFFGGLNGRFDDKL